MNNLPSVIDKQVENQNSRPFTDKDFIDRLEILANNLMQKYDQSEVKRPHYPKDSMAGGYNYGKTLVWIQDYAYDLNALESVAKGLEAIVDFPHSGSLAWETRRFIKFSQFHQYDEFDDKHYPFDNIPAVIEFGKLLARIGTELPYGKETADRFGLDMDFLFWGDFEGDREPSENREKHMRQVYGIIEGLKRFVEPNTIDIDAQPSNEEIEKENKLKQEQYVKDFLADSKSFYNQHSFFDILDREEVINRPQHRILTYPEGFMEVIKSRGVLNPKNLKDANDAITHYYEALHYMVDKRQKQHWGIQIYHDNQFEARLERTAQKKPWLLDFSVKWQELFGYSNVIGNRDTRSPGIVEYIYPNPSENTSYARNVENEIRKLEPNEEREFFESITDVTFLESGNTPKHGFCNEQKGGDIYQLTLSNGQKIKAHIRKDYGSIYGDGKLIIDGTGEVKLPLEENKRLSI